VSRPEEVLAAAVPAPVVEVCRVLHEAGHEALTVGGAVRDALLGRQVGDWDVTTSARPEQVMQLFRRTVATGIQHGTVTVLVGRGAARCGVEVTTFRGDGAYSDARRPDEVRFGVPLEEDLARRDFVINAMAYDPIAGHLVDPFGGAADLARRRLRAVGDPVQRFREDGLRVMRAVRFVATLEFVLDPATEAAIPQALPSLARVSWERIRDELCKLLAAPRPTTGLEIAQHSGVLGLVLPELVPTLASTAAALWAEIAAAPPDHCIRLAVLLGSLEPAVADEVARRLKLSNLERARVLRMVSHADAWRGPRDPVRLRRLLGEIGREWAQELLARWRAAGVRTGESEAIEQICALASGILAAGDALTVRELRIGGAALMKALGRGPGPWLGELLGQLLEQVHRDPSSNTPERLDALARALVEKDSSEGSR
jgi:tRNA nucleotidyltransferase (CCA-adding enzyme)